VDKKIEKLTKIVVVDKKIEKLTRVLNDFLKPFNTCCFYDTDFSYSPILHKIYYSLVMTDAGAKEFSEHFSSIAPDITCDVFLTSLLHELGHHMTLSTFSEEELDEYYDDAAYIRAHLDTEESSSEEYFNLPVEAAATNWAIEFIRNNADTLAKLWSKIQGIILEIYDNEVE
jgi:hypothetical protein